MSAMPSTGSSHPETSDGNELDYIARGRLPDEEAQIGVEPGPSVQTGIHLENDGDNSEPSSKMNLDEGARLWRDLEAETGYASYFDYLKAYEDDHLLLYFSRGLLEELIVHTAASDHNRCAIVDVQDEDDTSRKLTVRCNSKSGTEVLSSLRQQSAATRFRIVLWDSNSLTENMLNALGLGLKIQPHFFIAFLARHSKTPPLLDMGTDRKFSDDVVVIGQYVMTLIRDYLPANPDAAPIILIAAVGQEHWQIDDDYQETFPFQRLATQATNNTPNPLDQLPRWMKDYFHDLDSDLQKGRGGIRDDIDMAFGPLTTLLQFNIPLLRLECMVTRANYLQATKPRHTEIVGKVLKGVFEKRYLLRRMIEDSEDSSLRLRNCMHPFLRHDTPQSQSLMTLEVDLQQVRLEATRLEAEIRDYLQLQTGESALQESKKSIQLSNFQIEEAKRGQSKPLKIRQILANNTSENL